MSDNTYSKKQKRYRRLYKQLNPDWNTKDFEPAHADTTEEMDNLQTYLIEENSFENPLDRDIANWIIELGTAPTEDEGGYKLWEEVSFSVNGQDYAVAAYGNSEENEGEDAIAGMLFIKDDETIEPTETRTLIAFHK